MTGASSPERSSIAVPVFRVAGKSPLSTSSADAGNQPFTWSSALSWINRNPNGKPSGQPGGPSKTRRLGPEILEIRAERPPRDSPLAR